MHGGVEGHTQVAVIANTEIPPSATLDHLHSRLPPAVGKKPRGCSLCCGINLDLVIKIILRILKTLMFNYSNRLKAECETAP